MNMLVKKAEVEYRRPLSRSGIGQSPIRASMDDLTVTSASVASCRRFTPAKSEALIPRKGNVEDRFCFQVDWFVIPLLTEKTVKSLGKTFDSTLTDSATVQSTQQELKHWLCPGKCKAMDLSSWDHALTSLATASFWSSKIYWEKQQIDGSICQAINSILKSKGAS